MTVPTTSWGSVEVGTHAHLGTAVLGQVATTRARTHMTQECPNKLRGYFLPTFLFPCFQLPYQVLDTNEMTICAQHPKVFPFDASLFSSKLR